MQNFSRNPGVRYQDIADSSLTMSCKLNIVIPQLYRGKKLSTKELK